MKKMFFVLLLAGIAAIASPRLASAQSNPLLVKVPFGFIVADRVMPAGSYRVTFDERDSTLLKIETTQGKPAAVFIGTETTTIESNRGAEPTFKFKNIDGHMFLAAIVTGDTSREVKVTPAAAERTLAKLNLLGDRTYSTK